MDKKNLNKSQKSSKEFEEKETSKQEGRAAHKKTHEGHTCNVCEQDEE